MLDKWQDWVGTETGLVAGTVLALPVAGAVVCGLAVLRRAAGTPTGWAWRRSVAEVGLVYGTLPFVWLTLMPGSRAGLVPGRTSLVPLQDLLEMDTGQIIGNMLIFAALGFCAPMRFFAMGSLRRVLAVAGGASILIEVAQYVFQLDRVSSVDDVLLNATGAVLAALISRRWWRTRSDVPASPICQAA
ncbi:MULTISPECIES: VanZ family protein [unclassified Crossiella]|uniref:VanZ family protein n=1 Tax=unclassified Crossiella TaxID=2620835 RepID=UPI001FFFC33F|nr:MULTISPECIES: VanZ family protein [unclassified Crossiella]MCK2244495.1 VanZ family protein [Crossiella sp. S99.2]MCK2258126.1 VanZ family protein [Crossiella sp. S99.1]